MRSRCPSFSVALHRPGFGLLLLVRSNLARRHPPGTGEEHEHHGKVGLPSAESHEGGTLFVGDAALGRALQGHGAGPSAPKFLMETQTRSVINVIFC